MKCDGGYVSVWQERDIDRAACPSCGRITSFHRITGRFKAHNVPVVDPVTLAKRDDAYDVIVDGEWIGEVYRERQRSDRYPYGESQVARQGRWRWMNGFAGEDFTTRRAAVDDLLRRRSHV